MTPQQIEYSEIEQIIESHLIVYKGIVYNTVEDLKTYPDIITIKDPITREEFFDISDRLQEALRGW